MNYKKAVVEIVNWLNGDRNYQLGISYLKSYSNHTKLADSLLKFKNLKELENLLWKTLDELKKLRDKSDNVEAQTIEKPTKNNINIVKKSDNILEEMMKNYNSNLKLINILKAQYVMLGDNLTEENKAKRYDMNFELLELDAKSSELFFNIKFYEKYGTIPDSAINKENKKVHSLEIQKKDETLRKGISRYKKKIETTKKLLNDNPTKHFPKELKKINEWEIKMNKSISEREKLNNG